MDLTLRIGILVGDYDDRAPRVAYNSSDIDWRALRIGKDEKEMEAGLPPDPNLALQRVVVRHRSALRWDYYPSAGTFGIMSHRLKEAVAPWSTQCFSFWPVLLNDVEYFVVRRVGVIDCLDRSRSEFECFPGGVRIMSVRRYAFHKERVPEKCLFSIPDYRGPIFATASLIDALTALRLRGIEFADAEADQFDASQCKW